jgi:hypothetical protein
MCDASVHFLTTSIDMNVFCRLATIAVSVRKIREGNSELCDQDNLGSPSGVPR